MSRRPSSISSSRRGSSLTLIPEDQPPVTYEQSSGRTYVVQHLRGNAVVVRRTSSGGLPESRPNLQSWDRRPSAGTNAYSLPSSPSDWSSAVQTQTLRRASTQMSPLQMLPPPTASLSNVNPGPQPPSPLSSGGGEGAFNGSMASTVFEQDDVEMMDVDAASPCSSVFSTPTSSPPTTPGMAPPMTHARQPPKSPLRSKVAGWLRHI